jgi:hypothetical protein
MDPRVQEYLANKYQIGLNDDEKQVLSGADERANQLALSQGMMEAANTLGAGIAGQPKAKPLFNPESAYKSNDAVKSYIMNKLKERSGAAMNEAEFGQKQSIADAAARAKVEEAKAVAERESKRDAKSAERESARDSKADVNRKQDMTLKLQDQWNSDPNVKRAINANSTAKTIRGLAEKATGQSDIGLIMAFNRAIDQGARTTKDDYEAISAAKGVMDNLEAWQKKAETGEVLTPQQRKSMVEVAQRFADEAAADADNYHDTVFKPTATNAGLTTEITAYRPWMQKAKPEDGQATQAKPLKVMRAKDLP